MEAEHNKTYVLSRLGLDTLYCIIGYLQRNCENQPDYTWITPKVIADSAFSPQSISA